MLIDLGFATHVDDSYPIYSMSGTPGYIAPEYFERPRPYNWKLTTKSDIFSLGIVIYQILFKKYPWKINHQTNLF